MMVKDRPAGHRSRLRWVVAIVAAILLLSGGVAAATVPVLAASEQPLDLTFDSLEQAAEAGAIDAELVKPLLGGEKTDLFVILEPDKVIDAYGDGSEANLKTAAAVIKTMIKKVRADTDVTPTQAYALVPIFRVTLADEKSALRLINEGYVRSLTMDRLNELFLSDSLPLIRQPDVVSGGPTGAGTSVVVIDTGADITQSEFGLCTMPGDPAPCRVPVAMDKAPDDNSFDDNGHGTNVAAIAASVAPGTQIIPIDAHDGAGIPDHVAIDALDWVLANRNTYNIRAVNMSFGLGDHQTSNCGGTLFYRNPYRAAFSMLRNAKTLPVLSAGNSGSTATGFTDGIGYPACTYGAVSVGAIYPAVQGDDQKWSAGCVDQAPVAVDTIACFSQEGSLLTMLAPGVDIDAGISKPLSGTSQAAPHVAGAVAVLAQVAPTSSADDLQSFLTTSHTRLTDARSGRTHPRLDLVDAVRAAAPLANDDRAGATMLTGWGGRTSQTTWTATKEAGEADHGGDAGGASVWFRWIPTVTETALFTTEGSDFDTLLAIYREDANGGLTLLRENNDEDVGITTSLVTVPVAAGDSILIAVDGVNIAGTAFGASGHLTLTRNLRNDNIADAITLPAVIFVGGKQVTGSNVGATKEPGEPNHCGDQFARASVWYQWTPTSNQALRIRAGGTQPMCVAVYQAATAAGAPAFSSLLLQAAGADDEGYPIDFSVNAITGNTYWIAVEGISIETGCGSNGQCNYTTRTGIFQLQLN